MKCIINYSRIDGRQNDSLVYNKCACTWLRQIIISLILLLPLFSVIPSSASVLNENSFLVNNDCQDIKDYKVTYVTNKDKGGVLIVSDTSLFFRENKNRETELLLLKDIVGYRKEEETKVTVFTKDGRHFSFKTNRRNNIIEPIELARKEVFKSLNAPFPKLVESSDKSLLLVEGYADIMGSIVPMSDTTPDIIITSDMRIIEAVINRISGEEIIFYEYPLNKESSIMRISISSVNKVSMHDGKEYEYSNEANIGNREIIDGDILKTKGLWIINRDNQKLTYDSVSRFFDESNVDKYRHIRHKGNAGKTICIVGLGVLAFDYVLYELNLVNDMIDSSTMYNDSAPIIVYGASIVVGAALAVVGVLIHSGAEKDLASFIAEWNAQQKISVTKKISFGKTYSGYGIALNF